ncbi:trigger factor [Mycoplasma sp. CSL7491-lung]|uniref:trigger factor n=1 Tax=Mycoplasma sp. CSL7491-lung TaxID=549718 RepID=UPI001C10F8E0|nr:trigger factor [Mycoplasma sp. CSL7491-lung]MBU4693154.1 trigger factor [Mycoplasma sp. CSL7491-lung]
MIKHTQDVKNSQVVVSYTIKSDEFQKLFNESIDKKAQKVKVPGYRPGKAPIEKLRSYVNKEDVFTTLINNLARNKFSEIARYISENKLAVVLQFHELDIKNEENGDLVINYNFPMMPDLKKLTLKGIDTKFNFKKVGKKEVEDAKLEISEKFNGLEEINDKNEKTVLGDTVNIDFKGFIDDVAFEGGEAQGHDLLLGSKTFIPGFEDQLVGKKTGYKGDVVVKFPADYFVKEYRDKEATFQVTINAIKRPSKFDFNDDFVKGFKIEGVETLKEFEKLLKNKKEVEFFLESIRQFELETIEEIISKSKLEINRQLLQDRIKKLEDDFNNSLKQYGLKRKEYLSFVKTTEEELNEEFNKIASSELKKSLVHEYLFGELKINEEDKDFKEFKEKLQLSGEKGIPGNSAQEIEKTKSELVKTITFNYKLLVLLKKDKDAEEYKKLALKLKFTF